MPGPYHFDHGQNGRKVNANPQNDRRYKSEERLTSPLNSSHPVEVFPGERLVWIKGMSHVANQRSGESEKSDESMADAGLVGAGQVSILLMWQNLKRKYMRRKVCIFALFSLVLILESLSACFGLDSQSYYYPHDTRH